MIVTGGGGSGAAAAAARLEYPMLIMERYGFSAGMMHAGGGLEYCAKQGRLPKRVDITCLQQALTEQGAYLEI